MPSVDLVRQLVEKGVELHTFEATLKAASSLLYYETHFGTATERELAALRERVEIELAKVLLCAHTFEVLRVRAGLAPSIDLEYEPFVRRLEEAEALLEASLIFSGRVL